MKQEIAETIAVEAVTWIARDGDLLEVFMGASGASAGEIRERLADPEFLVAVLDFLLMDDAWVTGFCDSVGRPYDAPLHARAALPGGEEMHWT